MNNASQTIEGTDNESQTTALSLSLFIIVALALFFTALFGGGQPWAVIMLLVLVVQSFVDRRFITFAFVVPAFGWLALFRLTDNRELFFPFAMYLAAHVSLLLCRRSLWLGLVGGSVVVAVFLVLRYLQRATWPVLVVELSVAAGILGLMLIAAAVSPTKLGAHVLIAAAASGLAYCGLSI